MAIFEGYDRRIKSNHSFSREIRNFLSGGSRRKYASGKALMSEKLSRIFSRFHLKTPDGPTLQAPPPRLRRDRKHAADIAETLGLGLQSFCIPGSVADDRQVGIGHGNLAAMLLREETTCFAFCAGHESFAAAEGAIGLAKSANKARKVPLRVILNGLGKRRRSHYRPRQRIYPRRDGFRL